MKKQITETIDDFIANYPKDVQIILENVKRTIGQVAPKATETISVCYPNF